MPRLTDQLLQATACATGPLGVVEGGFNYRQALINGVVFLDQCAPDDFGRVGGKHQFDAHARQAFHQLAWRVAIIAGTRQQIRKHRLGAWLVILYAPKACPVVLFSNIGQIEKLVEGTRDWQQFMVRQFAQVLDQLAATAGISLAPALGQPPDCLDAIDELMAQVIGNGAPQTIAENTHVIA